MPTYVYECRKCGHQFDRFQPITAEPLKTCPKCKGKVARMLTTGAGIIFKGSGFYQTDYKKTSAPATEKHEPKKTEPAKTGSKPDKPAK
ncbi:MAG: zinc ribbon domain-containing protein [Opitutae bacterium]|nr:zinc ribbon domain-containing protein [Opitutae bacterium]